MLLGARCTFLKIMLKTCVLIKHAQRLFNKFSTGVYVALSGRAGSKTFNLTKSNTTV